MRLLPLLVVVLLMSPVLFTVEKVRADDGEKEEMIGDWVIRYNKTIVDRHIVLQGNLKIISGGLELINSSIEMRCYVDGQFRVDVGSGTYLRMLNSSISREAGRKAYYLVAKRMSDVELVGSEISGAGYGDVSGMYIEGKFRAFNTTFTQNLFALHINGTSGPSVDGCNFENNGHGIYLEDCRHAEIRDSVFMEHNNESILLSGGSDISVEGCSIKGSYGRNGGGIHSISVDHLSIRENTVNSTSLYGIFIEKGDENTTLYRNIIGKAGDSQIALDMCRGMDIHGNTVGHSYQAFLVRDSDNITIQGEELEALHIGVRAYSSNVTLRGIRSLDSTYFLLSYESNISIISLSWENVTHVAFFRNSLVYTDTYMDASDYYLRNDTSIYFYRNVRVDAVSAHGEPLPDVRVDVSFMGSLVYSTHLDENGRAELISPYLLHTTRYGRNYSWCEARAYGRHHFIENPIRYYSWDTPNITFKEVPKDMRVEVSVDPVEAMPGDVINIRAHVTTADGDVSNASLVVLLNGNMTSMMPKYVGNGTYTLSVVAPEFNGSLDIYVYARAGKLGGVGRTKVMEKEYVPPVEPPKEEERRPVGAYALGSVLAGAGLVIAWMVVRRRKKGGFEGMRALSPDEIEIEER